MTARKFIVCAPSFSDRSGGDIMLHLLCERLNAIGEDAAMLPLTPLSLSSRWTLRELLWLIKRRLTTRVGTYDTGPFPRRIARRSDIAEAVIVYAEIVAGNPAGASRIVRWFLNRPGSHTGKTGYGSGELYFFFQSAFDDPAINPDRDNHLMLFWINPVYRDLGRTDRAGSCHLMRKGAGRAVIHDPDSMPLDGLSHEGKMHAFNTHKYFYCYDLYTFYTIYAAVCGCIPIVVPDPALPKEKWIVAPEDRYGVAYGEDDIPWAIATRGDMLRRLDELCTNQDLVLRDFVAKCRAKFG